MLPPKTAAFERWVARIRPQLLRVAAGLLKDRDEAENVVQATLLAIWESSPGNEPRALDAYAKRAVWMNALRWRQRRRDTVSVEAAEVEAQPAEPFGDLTPWELEQAILGLPPAQQLVLRLRFYGGFSFQEIGSALSISINTAASRCRYALDALREAFKPKGTKPGEEP